MKYFTDEISDTEGYLEHLKHIKSRFSNTVYEFLSTNSFHDAHVKDIKFKNLFNTEIDTEIGREEADPSLIIAHILHSSGDNYIVKWHGVNKFLMDYDIYRNTYHDTGELAHNGLRGLDDWTVDEVTGFDEHYLIHNIILASDANIEIRFKSLEIKKI
jgi:hypothetical protein